MANLTRRVFLRSTGFGALGALGLGMYGKGSTHWVEQVKRTLTVPKWTQNGFRVGLISDSHLVSDWSIQSTRIGLDFILSERPDVIIFAGDFVEKSNRVAMERMNHAFSPVIACGIPAFAVLGNHDHATPVPSKVIRAARNLGFKVLQNEQVQLGGVTIAGLDSASFNLADPSFLRNSGTDVNRLVVLHEPDAVELLDGAGSLMVAGHSHGGQICLPTGVVLHTPPLARNYTSGFYPNARTPLYVSRGLGETGIRMRLFCRPEASILTLQGQGV